MVLREKGCVSVAKRRKAEAEGQMIAWNKCPDCGVAVEKFGNIPGKQRQAAQEGGKR